MDWLANNWIEVVAAITGVLGVWLTTRQNIWCWPVGLVGVVLSLIVFFQAKLYYDSVLQMFYFVLTLYGWYNWTFNKKEGKKLEVTSLPKIHLILYSFLILILVLIFGYIAENYTDAALPYWDAFTTAGGIIATLWMAKKIIENWLAWIIIDINCVGIYFYKELYAFSALYLVFTVLAVIGYLSWKKDLVLIKIEKL